MDTSTIITIIEKYAAGPLSSEEEVILAAWLRDVSPEEFHRTLDQCPRLPEGFREYRGISPAFIRGMESLLDAADVMAGMDEAAGSEDNGMVVVLNDRNEGRRWIGRRRWMAAASVILLLSAGIFLLVRERTEPAAVAVSEHKKQDAAPGHDGAILTLADGRQIVLDSVGNGALAMQGNVKIQKLSNGVVKYDNGREGRKETLYNTLATPRGRKTSLSLTDGTVVWLNASSSIRYPTVFTGKERLVEVTGEAYFEVAKNSAMPFVVRKAGSDERVEVLGTSFDINVYDDEEAAKTTLLEGSIKVIKGADGRVLKPGQQAVLGKGGGRIKIVSDVD
ncbi:MAG TPA: FecR domain-containing protein, partial [Puia sp.]|nr:FecR domain-containing protein [Puia sp.]